VFERERVCVCERETVFEIQREFVREIERVPYVPPSTHTKCLDTHCVLMCVREIYIERDSV